jgi:hypothetical protein
MVVRLIKYPERTSIAPNSNLAPEVIMLLVALALDRTLNRAVMLHLASSQSPLALGPSVGWL